MNSIGALGRGRRGWLLVALFAGVCWGAPNVASAAPAWSAPAFLNADSDSSLVALSCPTVSLCVAVDSHGREVSFDPVNPRAWSTYAIDGKRALTGLSCPVASQCVAVDGDGAAITFDPQRTDDASSRYVIDPGPSHVAVPADALATVSCASSSLCIAVDTQGHVISFAPTGSPDARLAPFGADAAPFSSQAVACPSSTQCTVIHQSSTESTTQPPVMSLITFDPRSFNVATTIPIPTTTDLTRLACPSVNECVGSGVQLSLDDSPPGDHGTVTVTVDPTSSATPLAVDRGGVANLDVACASDSLCTAMDVSGDETSFDPDSSGVLERAVVDPLGDYRKGANSSRIACPSTNSCVLVTWSESDVIDFVPLSPGKPVPVPIDDGGPFPALACAALNECVGLASIQLPYVPTSSVGALSVSGSHPGLVPTVLLTAGTARAISCPTSTQCTATAVQTLACGACALRQGTAELTFNPRRPPREHPFGSHGFRIDIYPVGGLACPSASACTIVDAHGREVTFDPIRPQARSTHAESTTALTSIGCPSANQCTAVGSDGIEVTFSTSTGALITRWEIDGRRQLTAVACPTARQCSAVDKSGRVLTFDPAAPTHHSTRQIDKATLTAVACPTDRVCVAVTATGKAAVGDPLTPHSWTTETIPGAGKLLAIACNSAVSCVATDSTGRLFRTVKRP